MTNHLLNKILLPDASPHSLSVVVSARSGSGKTTLITRLVHDALKTPQFKETRFIYVSVKLEHYFGPDVKPQSDLKELQKRLKNNNLAVFYPATPELYEEEVDSLIEMVFDLAGQNPEASFTVIVDDCNILQGFDNRGHPSPAMKKIVIAGRSKQIKLIPITHRLANMPRLFNGNISGAILMNMNTMDCEYGKKIYGLDFSDLITGLTDFRWAYIDFIDEHIERFNPVTPVSIKEKN